MAATNITELVLNQAPERLAQSSTRAEMIADIGARWTDAKSRSQQIFADSQRARSEGLAAWNKIQPLYKESKVLVEQAGVTSDQNVAQATMQKAGKVSIIRNLLAQRALLFRQQFEVFKYTGAAANSQQQLLETALRVLKQGHAVGNITDAQAKQIKSCVDAANALGEAGKAMATTPLPNLVQPSFSAERNAEISEAMNINVLSPDSQQPSPLPIPEGEPRYSMPQQASFSTNPIDALAYQIGVSGATGRSYPLGSLAAGATEAVAAKPSVLDVAHDGQVPRHPLTNLWGADKRPTMGFRYPRPMLPAALAPAVEAGYPAAPELAPYDHIGRHHRSGGSYLSGFNSPKAPDPLSYVNRKQGGFHSSLAGVLAEDTSGNRISTTNYSTQAAPTTTPDGSQCDWLCQLGKAFGAVGPQVGGALVGAGGATAAKGDVGGGAAMGLIGAGLAFFGNFFGGKAGPDVPKPVADDRILGMPPAVVYVGGGVAIVGLLFVLFDKKSPRAAAA